MGLPSGVQWANCNVGAESLSDPGLYFSWGNIEGHRIDEGYNFSEDAYNSTPGASIENDLSLEHDAARANLGTPWRMPTAVEFQELFDNSTQVWTTVNGVNGYLFTSNINGNTLFFPAAGFFVGETPSRVNTYGFYWSSTYASLTEAKRMDFDSSGVNPQRNSGRRSGLTVRAVLQLT